MKQFTKETFMSWENEGTSWNPETKKYEKDKVRAIALCDSSGWFDAAINCMRDGSMGEKDENGVYERIWWSDSIYEDEKETLRPATYQEVELYLMYCPIQIEDSIPYSRAYARIEDEHGIHIIFERRGWFGKNIRLAWNVVRYIPTRIRHNIWNLRNRWSILGNRNKPDKPNPNNELVKEIVNEVVERKQRRIIIKNEDELKQNIDYYQKELGSAYTLDDICTSLLERGCLSAAIGDEEGYSVSEVWVDKCHTFKLVKLSEDEAVFEYIGISKT